MESETAFVRTKSRIELDSVSSVHLYLWSLSIGLGRALIGRPYLSLVVLPDNTELDAPLWNGCNSQSFPVFRVLLEQ